MFKIINESVQSLHEISSDVKVPINIEDTKLAVELFQYVIKSQDDKYAKENNIRPGVGLACPQVGINKRMFAIHASDGDDTLSLIIINPKIVSTNKELVYLPGGEGCLSVDRTTEGVTPRYSKITVEGMVFDFTKNVFSKKKFKLQEFFAIVFQHEYDHLDGTLYVDKLISLDEAKQKNIVPLWEEETNEE